MNLQSTLRLGEALERLDTLSDRELIKLNKRLNEALTGDPSYGGDYARHSILQKRELAALRLRKLNEQDPARITSALFGDAEAPQGEAPAQVPQQAELLESPKALEPKAPAQNGAAQSDAVARKLAEAVGAALGDILTSGADIDAKISAAVDKALEARVPRRVELKLADLPAVDVTDKHPIFSLVLALVSLPKALRPNILLVGPAGCGKTTLANHVAQALSRPFGATSLSAGVSESSLTGWLLPVKAGGAFGYVPAGFVKDYENGAVHLLDELDASDPNVLCVVNAALANGHIYVQQKIAEGESPAIARHEDTVIICAANTFGTGADDLYQGRNALDAATLDRFLVLEMEYDEARELQGMGLEVKPSRPWSPSAGAGAGDVAEDLKALGSWLINLREAVNKAGLRRVVSSRMFDRAKALRAVGCSGKETQKRLLTGWSADDLASLKDLV